MGLNDATEKDRYPLPNITEMRDNMQGARYWSKFDAASAYWSVNINEEDKEKTLFSIPSKGKFEFNVMAYGLCNASATYQRLIDSCLAGISYERILVYMDNVVVLRWSLVEGEQVSNRVLRN